MVSLGFEPSKIILNLLYLRCLSIYCWLGR